MASVWESSVKKTLKLFLFLQKLFEVNLHHNVQVWGENSPQKNRCFKFERKFKKTTRIFKNSKLKKASGVWEKILEFRKDQVF